MDLLESQFGKIYKQPIVYSPMEFHIWDLERVHIKLKEEFLDYLNSKMKQKFNSKGKAYKEFFQKDQIPFATFKNILKKSGFQFSRE